MLQIAPFGRSDRSAILPSSMAPPLANGIGLYRLEGFHSRRPVIMLENPAVTIQREFFHVRLTPSLSMAFADMTEQLLNL